MYNNKLIMGYYTSTTATNTTVQIYSYDLTLGTSTKIGSISTPYITLLQLFTENNKLYLLAGSYSSSILYTYSNGTTWTHINCTRSDISGVTTIGRPNVFIPTDYGTFAFGFYHNAYFNEQGIFKLDVSTGAFNLIETSAYYFERYVESGSIFSYPGSSKVVVPSGTSATYAPSGLLIYDVLTNTSQYILDSRSDENNTSYGYFANKNYFYWRIVRKGTSGSSIRYILLDLTTNTFTTISETSLKEITSPDYPRMVIYNSYPINIELSSAYSLIHFVKIPILDANVKVALGREDANIQYFIENNQLYISTVTLNSNSYDTTISLIS